MTHEVPTPEQERPLIPGMFNVEAMSDEHIAITYRALFDAWGATGTSEVDADEFDAFRVVPESLALDVRNLAVRDPMRVRSLVQKLIATPNAADRNLAAETVESLLDFDYAYTRDALIYLDAHGSDGLDDNSWVTESARFRLWELRDSRLTPEQVADFNVRLDMRGLPLL